MSSFQVSTVKSCSRMPSRLDLNQDIIRISQNQILVSGTHMKAAHSPKLKDHLYTYKRT